MPNVYMQRASYKGIAFEVTSSTITAGRRVVLHEYPFRDLPFAEDLGRKARTVAIDAFIFGDNARQQSERLMAAIEAQGAGTLVHPLYGSMTCIATEGTQVSTELTDDYVRLSFTLTECGSLSFPSAASAADYLARLSADALQTAAGIAITSAMDTIESTTGIDLGTVYDETVSTCQVALSTIYDAAYTKTWALQDEVKALIDSADDVITDAGGYAQRVLATLGIAARASTDTDWREIAYQAASLAQDPVLLDGTTPAQAAAEQVASILSRRRAGGLTAQARVVSTSTTAAVQDAQAAVREMLRLTILAQAIGASTLVGTLRDRRDSSATALTVAPRLDVAAVRTAVITALDTECALHSSHEMLALLYDARVRVWTDLSQRADPVASLQTIELTHSAPSLVVAYDLYGDASRESEIVDRNAIARPFFCSGALEVLSA